MSLSVAIQGFAGSFHEVAARHYFGSAAAPLPCATFGEVVGQVAAGPADYGLLAIENSIAGSILPNYSLLRRADLRIVGEVYLRIRQHLLALPGQQLADIRAVHSHPMALLQCANFLHPHSWQLVETDDTARSAQRLRDEGRRGVAAVAGSRAAELFGLEILAADIHDEPQNYTRFLVLARAEAADGRPDKASLYFHCAHTRGSLAAVLAAIAGEGINLSKLQSCPQPGTTWHYYFHADLEFDEPARLDAALRALAPLTEGVQVLGRYRRGQTY